MSSYWVILFLLLIVPWVAKLIWPHEIKVPEVLATIAATMVIVSIVWFSGLYGQTADREIWNGEITKKERIHGHYLQSYSCNCRETCSGSGQNRSCSTTCDTCWEDRYTVDWLSRSTIGTFTIEKYDRSSKSVYASPDPARYTKIEVGDPCSRSVGYTNYIKAVPESLFHAQLEITNKFNDAIPQYPGKIYDLYMVDRVVPVNVNVPDLNKWNLGLANTLRKLGPEKQANAIIVFSNSDDPNFAIALQNAWYGGKKNDIVVVLGTPNYPKIEWVSVFSWSRADIFNVQLRDDLRELGVADRDKVLSLINDNTTKSFERRSMEEFEYLKDEIEPPEWVVILAALLGLATCFGLSYAFYRYDPFSN